MFRLRGFCCTRYLLLRVNVVCQLKKMEDSHQEATEKEVERILGYLKSYYQDDRELKVDLADINVSSVCNYYLFTCLLILPQLHRRYPITSLSSTPTRFHGQ